MPSVIVLNAECHCAECRYATAEYHYAECRYVECHGAVVTITTLKSFRVEVPASVYFHA
jgi:hypothetical protein